MAHFQAPLLHGKTTDIVLRSNDGVDYALHKSVLSERSQIFHDMLELGTSAEESSDTAAVQIEESSDALDLVFAYAYSCDDPELLEKADTTALVNALDALVKYAIRGEAYVAQALRCAWAQTTSYRRSERKLDVPTAARLLDFAESHDLHKLARSLVDNLTNERNLPEIVHKPFAFRVLRLAARHELEEKSVAVLEALARNISQLSFMWPFYVKDYFSGPEEVEIKCSDILRLARVSHSVACSHLQGIVACRASTAAQKTQILDRIRSKYTQAMRVELGKCLGPKGKKCSGRQMPASEVLFGRDVSSAHAALDAAESKSCGYCIERGGPHRFRKLHGLISAHHQVRLLA